MDEQSKWYRLFVQKATLPVAPGILILMIIAGYIFKKKGLGKKVF